MPDATIEPLFPDSIMTLELVQNDSVLTVGDHNKNIGFVIPPLLARDYTHLVKVRVPLQEDVINHYAEQNRILKKLNDNLRAQVTMSGAKLDLSQALSDTIGSQVKDYEGIVHNYTTMQESYKQEIEALNKKTDELDHQIDNLEAEKKNEQAKVTKLEDGLKKMTKIAKAKAFWKRTASIFGITTAVLAFVVLAQ